MHQPGRLVSNEPISPVSASPFRVVDRAAGYRPSAGSDRMLARGEHLYTAGSAPSGMYRVVAGAVALARSMPDGRRQIVDLLGPGRLVGLPAGAGLPVTATALVRTHLSRVPRLSALDLSSEISIGVARLHSLALLLGRKSALEKVASGLVDLAAQFGSRCPEQAQLGPSFVLPMTRTDLADWLGLVIETVSRALGDLQRRGLIVIERTDLIHVVDPKGLAAATGDRLVRRCIAS